LHAQMPSHAAFPTTTLPRAAVFFIVATYIACIQSNCKTTMYVCIVYKAKLLLRN
jgi:hypothetical protein